MKKILLVCFSVLSISISLAQENYQSYDCNIEAGNAISSGEIIKQPEFDLSVKLLHSYCIESRQKAKEPDFQPIENPAQSPMFVDQCVSVGFRKLDANKNLLYPGLEASATGDNRQKFLALETKRIDPGGRKNVFDEFERVWALDKADGYAWNYHKVCTECLYNYKNITRGQLSFNEESYKKNCYNLADNRIQAEQDFVESFSNQKLNFTIANSVDNYLNVYIAQQRMPALIDKINSSFSLFNTISQKMGPGTQSCNY